MRATLAAAVLALAVVPAPGSKTPGAPAVAASPDSIVIRDDAGRTVRFAAPPERVVSLVPAVTEILFALGAGDRLVGRTRYGVQPSAARGVPSVGEGMRPSLEAIVARSPEVVILYAGVGNRGALGRLEELGVRVLAVRHDGFPDLERNVERLGRLTGTEEAADALLREIDCELEAVARLTAGRPPVRVYYEVWADPPVTIGRGSYLDSLVTLAGGHNVFAELEAPSPTVGLEAIVAREPDVIVRAADRRGGAPPPDDRPGWHVLDAVREDRVRTVDGELVHRLGPRVGRAAAELAATLRPELRSGLRWERLRAACAPGG